MSPFSDRHSEMVDPYPTPNTLTLIGMSYESKKNAHLKHHLGTFFIRLNFHLKSLEIIDKESAEKI